MAMDAKDLRIETALGARNDDGDTKYVQSDTVHQTNGNKPYHNIGSNTLVKVDVSTARPFAIIEPDRVVPPQSTNEGYLKKVPVEPWPDNVYQHPPEYSQKPTEYQPSRNISPRQTFQENMQRIMVPPTYASGKNSEDNCLKNSKLMPLESKFCDVPYTVSPINNETKTVKGSEGLLTNNSSTQPVLPHGWAGSGVNVRPLRPYGAPELYQYSEYPNYPGPRPISMIRPHRSVHEEVPQVYQDRFYHEANIRFKPYPSIKERPPHHPQSRYEYISNYPGVFHPHTPYPHKYDLQKSIPTHPYSVYPSVPLKYLDRRMTAPAVEKYSRSPNQQVNYNTPICNQNIPSTYGSVTGNCLQNRTYTYTPDPSTKHMIQNKIYYECNNAHKYYTSPDNVYMNDINRPPNLKNDLLYSSYPPVNINSLPPHHMYRKETSFKGYEQALHYRNIEYSANINQLGRLPLQFLPQTMSIPSDSNTSSDTAHIVGNGQDDFGYISQSSTASARNFESNVNKLSSDVYRRNERLTHINKPGQKIESNISSKDKKDLNVRQFLQMWNEGDDEANDKTTSRQRDSSNSLGQYDSTKSQQPLYILDLVNVPNEDLEKYDHIQKISKLPENIKGYNNIELLNQYEKLVESPNLNHFSTIPSQTKQKDLNVQMRNSTLQKSGMEISSGGTRPISPLDVEAKISQSVIHKEVGCNFEIRPCSPQMMNVELATPVHNVLGERLIEKVANSVKTKSPLHHIIEETSNNSTLRNSPKITSCKMANNQYPSPNANDSLKTSYCLQDLESSSGVCLASLPRLDNDIELNFPEINQQFINANKILSTDLPILNTENTGSVHKIKSNNILKPTFVSDTLQSGSESDKEVAKLSKYRKHKRNSGTNECSNSPHTLANVALHRTDSVIIKNPETVKCQDEYFNHVPLINSPSVENFIKPENIIVQTDKVINYSENNSTEPVHERVNGYTSVDASDIALDFSLNKTDDEQTTINNFNDALQIDNELEKNNYLNSQAMTTTAVKLCNKNLSKQLQEISATDNLSILPLKSPILDDLACSDVPENNNIESKLIDASHETVISHSKPKEIESGMSLLIAESTKNNLENHIALNDDTDSLFQNTSINQKSGNNSEIYSNKDNQVLNFCLTECSDDVISSMYDAKYDFVTSNQKDDIRIVGMNVKDELSTKENEQNTSCENVSQKDNELDTKMIKNKVKDLSFQVSDLNKNEIVPSESESISNTTTCSQPNTDFLNPKEGSEQMIVEFNENDNVDLSNKCEGKILVSTELSNIKTCKNNDSNANSVNDINTTEVVNKEVDRFKNNESLSMIKDKNIHVDIENKTEILPLLDETAFIEKNKSDIYIKYEFILKKELFSPRFQNLLSYSEGFCTSLRIFGEENIEATSHYYYNHSSCLQQNDDELNISIKTILEENSLNPEITNVLNSVSESKIHKETIEELETGDGKAATLMKNKTIISTILLNDTDKGKQKDVENCGKKQTDVKVDPNVTGHCDSEGLLLDTAAKNTDEAYAVPKDKIGINISISDINENVSLTEQSLWNPLPNKRNRTLKRSLSESAVNDYIASTGNIKGNCDNNDYIHSNKRPKMIDSDILLDSQVLTDNLTSLIQGNRRNSISTIYNDENVSFCILIDNDCVLAGESENCQNICYTELANDCLTTICTEDDGMNSELAEDNSYEPSTLIPNEEEVLNSDLTEYFSYENNLPISIKTGILDHFELNTENSPNKESEKYEYENELLTQCVEDKSIEETWVEDVACIETVFSDDIAEDIVISAPSSPKDTESSDEEKDNTAFVYNVKENEHTNKVKYIYGNQMCDNDAELVKKLYRTPQMDVNKTLIDRESQQLQGYNRYYDNESLEKILSESNNLDTCALVHNDLVSEKSLQLPSNDFCDDINGNKENLNDPFPKQGSIDETYLITDLPNSVEAKLSEEKKSADYNDSLVQSCESSCDNFVANKKEEKLQYAISSSPEVSSTTSEEKGPGILLKIRSYKGSKISEINDMRQDFSHSHTFKNSVPTSKPLITKAAQKYIPPLKETIRDLKVKIRLPKQSLYKLQQLKNSKEEPKIDTSRGKNYIKGLPQEIPKKAKPKPKFEDVLMSIDEMQFKKHKEKNKKTKQSVPKVIIKKTQNGAHYASTQTKETFNPDLTGRKWQPWVFIEKSNFVDKMALKQKFKAIYSHRKQTFVLAENFRKYKSFSNANFVISHPKSNNDNISSGKLKYTFRLKHT